MTAVEVPVGTARLPQVRRIVTAIPGPRSTELAARRSAAVPAGLTSASGVYAAAAGDGVLVDVDGNSFIDLGSGIAVTSVGNSAPRVVDRVIHYRVIARTPDGAREMLRGVLAAET